MKKLVLLFVVIITITGCKKDVEFNGNIEIYVKKVISICSVPYDDVVFGLFPPEAANSETYSYGEIASEKIDKNGYFRFDNLPAGIYIIAVKAGYYCNASKYAIVRSGETTKINFID